MSDESVYFDVSPKIVPADCEVEVTIRPLLDVGFFKADTTYEVTYFPCEEFARQSGWPEKDRPPVRIVDGTLRVRQYFESEQEHVLLVEACRPRGAAEQLAEPTAGLTEDRPDDERTRVGSFRVYSLRDDLFQRRPYKGDLHVHSNRSDGRESPAYVAGAGRRIGLDFLALTDHGQYAPSIEAQDAFQGLEIDLEIVRGEEVHAPGNPAHIVNFGGESGICERFAAEEQYIAAVKAVEDKLGPLPAGVDPYQYASCLWIFDRIRQANGLGIFCHPYWFAGERYTPSAALTTKLLEAQPYDALELIGGYARVEVDSNTLQVARYHDERAQGRKIPIVGSSDAHGCDTGTLFGWYYTIVLAPSPALPGLIGSIKDLYSVAVEALPGEAARAYGPFRLVKYALFLMREVFPRHDALCREEGRLMLAHIAGEVDAADALARLSGRTQALYDRFWATA